jgi:hypothetical protein
MSEKRLNRTDMKSDAVWEALGQLEGGLKVFRYRGIDPKLDNCVSLADQSGYFPEQTDDGPLWIDDTRECIVNLADNYISIPVIKEQRKLWTGLNLGAALDLIRWVNGRRGCMLRFTPERKNEVTELFCRALQSHVIA